MTPFEAFKPADPLDADRSEQESLARPEKTQAEKKEKTEAEFSPKAKMEMMQLSFQKALDQHSQKVAQSQKEARAAEVKAREQNKNADFAVQGVLGPAGLFVPAEETQTQARIPSMASESADVSRAAQVETKREKIVSGESAEQQAKQKADGAA